MIYLQIKLTYGIDKSEKLCYSLTKERERTQAFDPSEELPEADASEYSARD